MRNNPAKPDQRKGNVAAVGGVVGAILASSCCIAPLLLLTLGATGAWIGNLTELKTYQPLFVAATVVFLGIGFWQVYLKRTASCDTGNCDSPLSSPLAKSALWAATVLVLLALTVDFWAPIFY